MNTALQSPSGFSSLIFHDRILQAVARLGLTEPTPVQREAMPRIIAGKDVIVQAKTGSGKTFAFVLPLLSHLESLGNQVPYSTTYGLILTPTRELANQIAGVVDTLAAEYHPACLIGGGNPREQERDLKKDSRVVVGTPGRVLDFIQQGKLKLAACQYIVLDEADEMLSMGFIDDIRSILSRLPKERQGVFVSATISPYIESLAHSFLKNPERITVATPASDVPQITHYIVEVPIGVGSKTAPLLAALAHFAPRSAIVFCNTKSDTELVEVILKRKGFSADKLNSDLSQKERERIMERMRSGELKILIGTDIAARGIDIDSVDLVVNYSIHEQPEIYVHRTGRTGRAGREGVAVSLVGPQDFSAYHNLKKAGNKFEFKKLDEVLKK